MSVRCVLCEADLPADTRSDPVTRTYPGPICAACLALPPSQRDERRSHAMTRMLRNGA